MAGLTAFFRTSRETLGRARTIALIAVVLFLFLGLDGARAAAFMKLGDIKGEATDNSVAPGGEVLLNFETEDISEVLEVSFEPAIFEVRSFEFDRDGLHVQCLTLPGITDAVYDIQCTCVCVPADGSSDQEEVSTSFQVTVRGNPTLGEFLTRPPLVVSSNDPLSVSISGTGLSPQFGSECTVVARCLVDGRDNDCDGVDNDCDDTTMDLSISPPSGSWAGASSLHIEVSHPSGVQFSGDLALDTSGLADLGGVSVQTGDASADAAIDLGAAGFVHGVSCPFSGGGDAPRLELLGHELAHVVQQKSSVELRSSANGEWVAHVSCPITDNDGSLEPSADGTIQLSINGETFDFEYEVDLIWPQASISSFEVTDLEGSLRVLPSGKPAPGDAEITLKCAFEGSMLTDGTFTDAQFRVMDGQTELQVVSTEVSVTDDSSAACTVVVRGWDPTEKKKITGADELGDEIELTVACVVAGQRFSSSVGCPIEVVKPQMRALKVVINPLKEGVSYVSGPDGGSWDGSTCDCPMLIGREFAQEGTEVSVSCVVSPEMKGSSLAGQEVECEAGDVELDKRQLLSSLSLDFSSLELPTDGSLDQLRSIPVLLHVVIGDAETDVALDVPLTIETEEAEAILIGLLLPAVQKVRASDTTEFGLTIQFSGENLTDEYMESITVEDLVIDEREMTTGADWDYRLVSGADGYTGHVTVLKIAAGGGTLDWWLETCDGQRKSEFRATCVVTDANGDSQVLECTVPIEWPELEPVFSSLELRPQTPLSSLQNGEVMCDFVIEGENLPENGSGKFKIEIDGCTVASANVESISGGGTELSGTCLVSGITGGKELDKSSPLLMRASYLDSAGQPLVETESQLELTDEISSPPAILIGLLLPAVQKAQIQDDGSLTLEFELSCENFTEDDLSSLEWYPDCDSDIWDPGEYSPSYKTYQPGQPIYGNITFEGQLSDGKKGLNAVNVKLACRMAAPDGSTTEASAEASVLLPEAPPATFALLDFQIPERIALADDGTAETQMSMRCAVENMTEEMLSTAVVTVDGQSDGSPIIEWTFEKGWPLLDGPYTGELELAGLLRCVADPVDFESYEPDEMLVVLGFTVEIQGMDDGGTYKLQAGPIYVLSPPSDRMNKAELIEAMASDVSVADLDGDGLLDVVISCDVTGFQLGSLAVEDLDMSCVIGGEVCEPSSEMTMEPGDAEITLKRTFVFPHVLDSSGRSSGNPHGTFDTTIFVTYSETGQEVSTTATVEIDPALLDQPMPTLRSLDVAVGDLDGDGFPELTCRVGGDDCDDADDDFVSVVCSIGGAVLACDWTVSNPDSSGFDLSVFGFNPEEIRSASRNAGGADLQAELVVSLVDPTGGGGGGGGGSVSRTFAMPHVFETKGRISSMSVAGTPVLTEMDGEVVLELDIEGENLEDYVSGAKAKAWMVNNFQISCPDGSCTARVSKIDAFTIKQGTTGSRGGSGTGKVSLQDIHFTKRIDKSTPLLMMLSFDDGDGSMVETEFELRLSDSVLKELDKSSPKLAEAVCDGSIGDLDGDGMLDLVVACVVTGENLDSLTSDDVVVEVSLDGSVITYTGLEFSSSSPDTLELSVFGFNPEEIVAAAARTGRNPQTGKEIKIAARCVVSLADGDSSGQVSSDFTIDYLDPDDDGDTVPDYFVSSMDVSSIERMEDGSLSCVVNIEWADGIDPFIEQLGGMFFRGVVPGGAVISAAVSSTACQDKPDSVVCVTEGPWDPSSLRSSGWDGTLQFELELEEEIISPRDAASGLPTGKRQHKPVSVTKPIDKSTPLLMSISPGGVPVQLSEDFASFAVDLSGENLDLVSSIACRIVLDGLGDACDGGIDELSFSGGSVQIGLLLPAVQKVREAAARNGGSVSATLEVSLVGLDGSTTSTSSAEIEFVEVGGGADAASPVLMSISPGLASLVVEGDQVRMSFDVAFEGQNCDLGTPVCRLLYDGVDDDCDGTIDDLSYSGGTFSVGLLLPAVQKVREEAARLGGVMPPFTVQFSLMGSDGTSTEVLSQELQISVSDEDRALLTSPPGDLDTPSPLTGMYFDKGSVGTLERTDNGLSTVVVLSDPFGEAADGSTTSLVDMNELFVDSSFDVFVEVEIPGGMILAGQGTYRPGDGSTEVTVSEVGGPDAALLAEIIRSAAGGEVELRVSSRCELNDGSDPSGGGSTNRSKGTVKFFNETKGFGFVIDPDNDTFGAIWPSDVDGFFFMDTEIVSLDLRADGLSIPVRCSVGMCRLVDGAEVPLSDIPDSVLDVLCPDGMCVFGIDATVLGRTCSSEVQAPVRSSELVIELICPMDNTLESELRAVNFLECFLTQYSVVSPRDAASGMPTGKRDAASGLPTGKRQHKPVTITKEVDKATPKLAEAVCNGSVDAGNNENWNFQGSLRLTGENLDLSGMGQGTGLHVYLVDEDGDETECPVTIDELSSGEATVQLGLLLPAVQKVREAASRSRSKEDVYVWKLRCVVDSPDGSSSEVVVDNAFSLELSQALASDVQDGALDGVDAFFFEDMSISSVSQRDTTLVVAFACTGGELRMADGSVAPDGTVYPVIAWEVELSPAGSSSPPQVFSTEIQPGQESLEFEVTFSYQPGETDISRMLDNGLFECVATQACVVSPRDAASGMPTGRRDAASGLPTGKRQHKPLSLSFEVGRTSPPQLSGGGVRVASGDLDGDGRADVITSLEVSVDGSSLEGLRPEDLQVFVNFGNGEVEVPVQGFVVNAHTSAMDLSVFGFDPVPIASAAARKAGGEQQEYLTIKLSDVLISSYSTSGASLPDSSLTIPLVIDYLDDDDDGDGIAGFHYDKIEMSSLSRRGDTLVLALACSGGQFEMADGSVMPLDKMTEEQSRQAMSFGYIYWTSATVRDMVFNHEASFDPPAPILDLQLEIPYVVGQDPEFDKLLASGGSVECVIEQSSSVAPRDAASGLPTGKRQHKPISITKELDKSTPLLMQALCTNENVTENADGSVLLSFDFELQGENLDLASWSCDLTHPGDGSVHSCPIVFSEKLSFSAGKGTASLLLPAVQKVREAPSRYNFFEAWPCQWKGMSFGGESLPMETISLNFDNGVSTGDLTDAGHKDWIQLLSFSGMDMTELTLSGGSLSGVCVCTEPFVGMGDGSVRSLSSLGGGELDALFGDGSVRVFVELELPGGMLMHGEGDFAPGMDSLIVPVAMDKGLRFDESSLPAGGEIDVLSWSWGESNAPRDAASGQATGRRDAASGQATGRRTYEPIVIRKRIDKATPMLFSSVGFGGMDASGLDFDGEGFSGVCVVSDPFVVDADGNERAMSSLSPAESIMVFGDGSVRVFVEIDLPDGQTMTGEGELSPGDTSCACAMNYMKLGDIKGEAMDRAASTGEIDVLSWSWGEVVSPRDAASGLPTGKREPGSGLATGKRQHKPFSVSLPVGTSSSDAEHKDWIIIESMSSPIFSNTGDGSVSFSADFTASGEGLDEMEFLFEVESPFDGSRVPLNVTVNAINGNSCSGKVEAEWKVEEGESVMLEGFPTRYVFPAFSASGTGNVAGPPFEFEATYTEEFVKSWSVSGDADDRPTEEVSFTFQKITWTWQDGGITAMDDWQSPAARSSGGGITAMDDWETPVAMTIDLSFEGQGLTSEMLQGAIVTFTSDTPGFQDSSGVLQITDSSAGRQRASVTCGDVVVVRELDKSSTKLMMGGTLSVQLTGSDATGRLYEEIAIKPIRLELSIAAPGGNIGSSGEDGVADSSSGDGSVPTESLSLNFTKIEWTWQDGNVTAMDDWESPVARTSGGGVTAMDDWEPPVMRVEFVLEGEGFDPEMFADARLIFHGDTPGAAPECVSGPIVFTQMDAQRTKGETTLGDIVVVRELDQSSTSLPFGGSITLSTDASNPIPGVGIVVKRNPGSVSATIRKPVGNLGSSGQDGVDNLGSSGQDGVAGASSGDGSVPTESLSLNFTKIEWKWQDGGITAEDDWETPVAIVGGGGLMFEDSWEPPAMHVEFVLEGEGFDPAMFADARLVFHGDTPGAAPECVSGPIVFTQMDAQRTKGETTLGDIVVVRELDKSSTKLQLGGTMTLQGGAASRSSSVETVVAKMQRVELAISAPGGGNGSEQNPDTGGAFGLASGDADDRPTEEIAFTYQKIEWTWQDGGITAEDDWETPVALAGGGGSGGALYIQFPSMHVSFVLEGEGITPEMFEDARLEFTAASPGFASAVSGPLTLTQDGAGRVRGDTTLGDVVVVRELDKSSTKLQLSGSFSVAGTRVRKGMQDLKFASPPQTVEVSIRKQGDPNANKYDFGDDASAGGLDGGGGSGGSAYGGARATYLKYEMKNVMVSSFSVSSSGQAECVVDLSEPMCILADGSAVPASEVPEAWDSVHELEVVLTLPDGTELTGMAQCPVQTEMLSLSLSGDLPPGTTSGREDTMEIYGFSHEVVSPRDAASGLPTGKREPSFGTTSTVTVGRADLSVGDGTIDALDTDSDDDGVLDLVVLSSSMENWRDTDDDNDGVCDIVVEFELTNSSRFAIDSFFDITYRLSCPDGTTYEGVTEYQNGDDPLLRKRPGRTKYSNITLKRGYVSDGELQCVLSMDVSYAGDDAATRGWITETVQGKPWKRTVTIKEITKDGSAGKTAADNLGSSGQDGVDNLGSSGQDGVSRKNKQEPYLTYKLKDVIVTSYSILPQPGYWTYNEADNTADIELLFDIEGSEDFPSMLLDGAVATLSSEAFDEVSAVIEYQDGDDPVVRKRPGRVKYSNITLKPGYASKKGYDYYQAQSELACSVSIVLSPPDSEGGSPAFRELLARGISAEVSRLVHSSDAGDGGSRSTDATDYNSSRSNNESDSSAVGGSGGGGGGGGGGSAGAKEKFDRSKPHVNIGTIGHVDHGRTSQAGESRTKLFTNQFDVDLSEDLTSLSTGPITVEFPLSDMNGDGLLDDVDGDLIAEQAVDSIMLDDSSTDLARHFDFSLTRNPDVIIADVQANPPGMARCVIDLSFNPLQGSLPNLLEARKGANESAAIATLRTLVTVESLYRDADGAGESPAEHELLIFITPVVTDGPAASIDNAPEEKERGITINTSHVEYSTSRVATEAPLIDGAPPVVISGVVINHEEQFTTDSFFDVDYRLDFADGSSYPGVVEYQDGNDLILRKRPGRVKYGDITLKRGMLAGNDETHTQFPASHVCTLPDGTEVSSEVVIRIDDETALSWKEFSPAEEQLKGNPRHIVAPDGGSDSGGGEGGGPQLVVFPDVAKTPAPGGPIPIPYPNMATGEGVALRIEIENMPAGTDVDSAWETCSGGSLNIEISDSSTGSDQMHTTTPGHKYVDTLTLRGAMTQGRKDMLQWYTDMVQKGPASGELHVLLSDGTELVCPLSLEFRDEDSDGDGILDYLDSDSDDDGVSESMETGDSSGDAANGRAQDHNSSRSNKSNSVAAPDFGGGDTGEDGFVTQNNESNLEFLRELRASGQPGVHVAPSQTAVIVMALKEGSDGDVVVSLESSIWIDLGFPVRTGDEGMTQIDPPSLSLASSADDVFSASDGLITFTGLEFTADASQDQTEYMEGGSFVVRKRPGRVKYGDVTLKRGYIASDLQDWWNSVAAGADGEVEIRVKSGLIQLEDGSAAGSGDMVLKGKKILQNYLPESTMDEISALVGGTRAEGIDYNSSRSNKSNAIASPPDDGGATAGDPSEDGDVDGRDFLVLRLDISADQEDTSSIELSFPWPDDNNDRGWYFLPEVDDEVLVSFQNGDPDRPIVIGRLYSGEDAPEGALSMSDPALAESVKIVMDRDSGRSKGFRSEFFCAAAIDPVSFEVVLMLSEDDVIGDSAFQLISNVQKTRHESAMSSIRNMK
jgi:type VI protein secretion system component Hcp